MEIILLDDIANVGHEGDVVEVADGYARNYLIPKQLAARVTDGNLKELEQRRRAIATREEHKRVVASELVERLKEETIIIQASVGEGGRLHGEVTRQNIADAVAEQLDVEIERSNIEIPVPIRETGNYLITATAYKDITAELPIRVVGPGGIAEPSEEEAGEVEEEAEEAPEAAETNEEQPVNVSADEQAEKAQ